MRGQYYRTHYIAKMLALELLALESLFSTKQLVGAMELGLISEK